MKKINFLSLLFALLLVFNLTGCESAKISKKLEIWSTYNTVKVIKQSSGNKSYKKLSAEINIDMMKGEYEGGQIIITSNKNADFTLEMSDLTSKSGNKIPANNVAVYLQRYIEIKANFNGSPQFTAGDYIPDMLMPYDIAISNKLNKLYAGCNQGITVEVNSADAKSGKYTGELTLNIDGDTKKVPVNVNVWDIEYSGRREFQSCFLIYNDQLTYGEYDNSKEVTDTYIDFLLKYKINAYVVRDNYPDEHLKECVENFKNNNFNSIVIPVDFPLGYSPDSSDVRFNKAIEYITWLGEQSTEENMYVKYAYFYPSTYDEADIVDERKEPSVNFFSPNGNYQKTINAAIDNLNKSKEFLAKPKSLRDEITDYIRKIPPVFTNVNYIDEWVNSLDATFCPYVSLLNNNAILKKYQKASTVHANNKLWIYSCSSPNYPYPTFHIDDSALKMRINGWMDKAYNLSGYLYYEVNKYSMMHDEDPNGYIDVYEDATRFSKTNGDGFLLYPGKYYGSKTPFATLRLNSYRDGMDDYDMLCVYEKLLKEKAEEYGILNFDFSKNVSDLYNRLFTGVIDTEDDFDLYEARKELAKRILKIKDKDGLIIDSNQQGDKLSLNIYSKSKELTVNGETLTPAVSGNGYKYSYIPENKEYKLKIKTSENEYEYAVSKHKLIKSSTAKLSEGSLIKAVSDGSEITVKSIDAEEEMKNLVHPIISFRNSDKIKNLNFSYKNIGNEDIEFAVKLSTSSGKIDISDDFCAAGDKSYVHIDFEHRDIKWKDVSGIEISFENTLMQGDTSVLAPDKSLIISDIWVNLE